MCQHNLPCSIVLPTACFPEGPSPHFTFCSFWRRRPRLEAVTPSGLGGDSVIVDLLLIVAPIVCESSVFGRCFVIQYFGSA